MKSFDKYFENYKNYDEGGELDKRIIADAKRVYETLKTTKAIEKFTRASYETQHEMVEGLAEGHSGFSFACVCQCAYRYAQEAEKEALILKKVKDLQK